MKHINVYVVLLQRTLLLDAAGPLEVLRVANREQQDIRFEVHYIGPETPIVSSIGITLAKIEPLPKTLPNDAMVVLFRRCGLHNDAWHAGRSQASWGPGCSRWEVAAGGGPAGA